MTALALLIVTLRLAGRLGWDDHTTSATMVTHHPALVGNA